MDNIVNPIQANLNRSTDINYNKLITFAVCVDNNDPQRAARIRAIAVKGEGLTNSKIIDPLKAIESLDSDAAKNKTYRPWSISDPYLLTPFLPIHLNVIPRKGEAIKSISYETVKDNTNREYVGPLISQFGEIKGDNFSNSQIVTSFGSQNVPQPDYAPEGIPLPEGKGSFPNPEDIAIVGRDNCDILLGMREKSIRDETEESPENWYPQILIRSGKLIKNNKFYSRPTSNIKQTFIQLNTFPQSLVAEEIEVEKTIVDDAPLATLIEWNLDQVALGNGSLTGHINFLKMPYKSGTNNKVFMATDFNVETVIPPLGFNLQTNLVCRLDFANVSGDTELSMLINDFIKKVDNSDWVGLKAIATSSSTITYNTDVDPDKVGEFLNGLLHPLYFRPNNATHGLIAKAEPSPSPTNYAIMNQRSNAVNSLINLEGVKTKGFGLAFTTNKGKRQPPVTTKKQKETIIKTQQTQQGIISAGAEKIYLFSYNSSDINGQIKLDTNYGISQEKFASDLEKQTNSLVRGEKLIELLKAIVNQVNNHVHDYPGNPPVNYPLPKTDLTKLVDNAERDMLNKNIRIN